jgi:hypothetical protein
MQQMTVQYLWIDSFSAEGIARTTKRLWKYGWPLVFVLGMTVLAQYGPPTRFTKSPDSEMRIISQPFVHSVK